MSTEYILRMPVAHCPETPRRAPTHAQQVAALAALGRAHRDRTSHVGDIAKIEVYKKADKHAQSIGVHALLDGWGMPWCLGVCAGDGVRLALEEES